ncbi:nucleotide-diphospho-sugar transferase [Rhizoclosmatium globosum]|uniref:Translation initiation factor eIF2B subunit epsilon n=1 Tax=Rhizoclosmatium globosum TaxID=329046 RepID=A0A1Y2B9G5_9FUNG|nr:nucleotide-diphospho-sugar transferase [Rhizoclosmatium globosum]ORY40922.1 nucleotide-diphospho-sugar transferase [Rhizoclosmatium globosum]|eukprot:ORY31492.1 nucleotide-diphospho-sugar transferase [Rhizoclosmatium globosum]
MATKPKDKAQAQEKVQVDEELVAVVVADSFNKRFLPLTEDKPRCLLPLANVPLIEYTLEFLATAGVEQIYVVCCSHADQIKAYLKSSRWGKSTFPKVNTFVSQQLASTGDALRDLDAKQLLKSDFILVSGDVVANMDLTKALEEHRARRVVDKNAIMTMVVKAASPAHRTRSKGEEGIYVLNAATQECVQYRSLFPIKQKLKLDLELFKAHSELQVRNDLIDCQIDICSVDVPALFTENFDYQDIRKHFVRGILESDILGKQIHCHIITDTYAARVRSTQMYDSISKDVMARWTYPMVPETNIMGTSYTHHSPYIYKDESVILQFGTKLVRYVVVGEKTSIGDKTTISESVIGRNCRIGKNVVINGSYIWDNVVIGDNCVIERSILADGVVVLNGVKIEKGSILSYGVQVGPEFTVKEFARLSLNKGRVDEDSDFDEEESDAESDDEEYDETQVGEDGKGYEKKDIIDADDDDDEEEHKAILAVCSIARDIQLHDIEDAVDEDTEDEDDLSDVDALERSHRELISTIERAFEENHSIDNIVLELNTLKFADNLDFHDIRLTAVPTVLSLVTNAATLQTTLKRWGGLLARFATDAEDQLDLLQILEEHCKTNDEHAKLFVKILTLFYNLDICEEDAFFVWFKKSSGKLRDSAKPFITWLQEAEEESSD